MHHVETHVRRQCAEHGRRSDFDYKSRAAIVTLRDHAAVIGHWPGLRAQVLNLSAVRRSSCPLFRNQLNPLSIMPQRFRRQARLDWQRVPAGAQIYIDAIAPGRFANKTEMLHL
jgi:hypothetical protein